MGSVAVEQPRRERPWRPALTQLGMMAIVFAALYARSPYSAPPPGGLPSFRDALRDFRSPGAILFALHKPILSERWFGYHEVWHAFGVAAGVVLFVANAGLVRAG